MRIPIVIFLLIPAQAFALPNLYDSKKLENYPAFERWVIETGGEKKACSPTAWAALGWMGYAEPDIGLLVSELTDSETDRQAAEILTEGLENGCYKVALTYAFYRVLGTNEKGETNLWNTSRPIVLGVYSGEQIDGSVEDVFSAAKKSIESGRLAIINILDPPHTGLVTDIVDGKFVILGGGRIDPDNVGGNMNFVNLRTFDGTYAESPEELYSGNGGFCFVANSVFNGNG